MRHKRPARRHRRSAVDDPNHTTRFMAKLAAAGLAVLFAAAAVLTFEARRIGLASASISSSHIASISAHTVVEPRLVAGLLAAEPTNLAGFDAAIREFVLKGSLVRVKLMTEDGRVVYSDEPRLIGGTYPLDPEQRDVLVSRQTRTSMSDPDSAEDRFEGTSLLEVYVGIRGTAGEPLLFEAYFRADEARSVTSQAWHQLVVPALGALLIMQVAYLPTLWSLAHRLRLERHRLLRRVAESSTMERRRIAGDLHDGVVPELTGLGYQLDATTRGSPPLAELRAVVVDASDRLRNAVEALRSLLVDLYPPDVAAAGLPIALGELASAMRRSGIQVAVSAEELAGVPVPIAAILFRTAQEALRNTATHSGAGHVVIIGRRTAGNATLVVEDDGRGFDPVLTWSRPRQGHLGLRLLDDLVSGVGGRLTIRSSPGLGTTLEVEVPVT